MIQQSKSKLYPKIKHFIKSYVILSDILIILLTIIWRWTLNSSTCRESKISPLAFSLNWKKEQSKLVKYYVRLREFACFAFRLYFSDITNPTKKN